MLREEGGDRRAFVQVDIMRVEIAFPCNTGRERRRERRRDTGKTDGFSRMEIISFSEKISSSFIFDRKSFSTCGEQPRPSSRRSRASEDFEARFHANSPFSAFPFLPYFKVRAPSKRVENISNCATKDASCSSVFGGGISIHNVVECRLGFALVPQARHQ